MKGLWARGDRVGGLRGGSGESRGDGGWGWGERVSSVAGNCRDKWPDDWVQTHQQ